jgi:hypothetical protein
MAVSIETPTGTVDVTPRGDFICISPKSEIITSWIYQGTYGMLSVSWGERRYHYKDVEFSTVHAMMTADSLGQFLNKVVKPNHEVV